MKNKFVNVMRVNKCFEYITCRAMYEWSHLHLEGGEVFKDEFSFDFELMHMFKERVRLSALSSFLRWVVMRSFNFSVEK